jgi:DNA-binding SARP family transcriptional activator
VRKGSVEVAVLGPVELRGGATPCRRTAALDLIVYLAFRRRPVTHAQWAEAIWPDRAVSSSTVYATASDARRALGRTPDGEAHLRRGPRLSLGSSVRTDVERFAALVESGDPWRTREAFSLVRGPLFSGLRRVDWAVFDGTRSSIEAVVTAAALRGAHVFLRQGVADVAEWMLRRALVVNPFDVRLYRSLLRATAAQGGRARLTRTLTQLRVFAGEQAEGGEVRARGGLSGGPADLRWLDPRTAALYRDLLAGEPADGGHPARL